MSIFNAGYIIGGLAMFVLGLLVISQSIIFGIFGILAGASFVLLGIAAVARNIR